MSNLENHVKVHWYLQRVHAGEANLMLVLFRGDARLQTYTSNTRFRLRFMIQKQTHNLVFTQLHYIETLKTPARYKWGVRISNELE